MKFNDGLFSIATIFMILLSACGGQQVPPAPTLTPSPTIPPTPTAIPSTPTPTPGPAGLCANVLNPLLPDSRWVYAASDTTKPWTIEIIVTGVDQQANVVAHIQIWDMNGKVIEDNTICDQGALQNFPLIFASMLLSDYMDGVLNTYNVSGVYAPSYETLVENNWLYSWDLVEMLEDEVAVTQSAIPNIVYMTKLMNITVHSDIVPEREALTVPAGTFPQSMKVSQEIIFPVSVWTASSSMMGELTLQATQWYEPYIGLLKMQVDSASISFVEGVDVPLTIGSAITLTEFTQGK